MAKKAAKKKAAKNAAPKRAGKAGITAASKKRARSTASKKSSTSKRSSKKTAAAKSTAKKSKVASTRGTGRAAVSDEQATPAKKRRTQTTAKRKTGGSTVKRTSDRQTTPVRDAKRASRIDAAKPPTSESPATHYDPIQFTEERPKLPKTKLSARELREFRKLLLCKRSELMGDVERLTDEALHRQDEGEGDNSAMPIHMADRGSDNWEQDFTLGLIANERALVREIDEALERVAVRTYGICLATHEPIGMARLRAKPWAKYCIEYARAREDGRAS